jgi:hypothetical protein
MRLVLASAPFLGTSVPPAGGTGENGVSPFLADGPVRPVSFDDAQPAATANDAEAAKGTKRKSRRMLRKSVVAWVGSRAETENP